jgi:hypothetical protein
MSTTTLQKQFITDTEGKTIGVIMPIEELWLMEQAVQEQRRQDALRLEQMRQAANDPLFLQDLEETMTAFSAIDAEWWERKE